MLLRKTLPNLLRKYFPITYPKTYSISSKTTHGRIILDKEVQEVDDVLNQEVAALLCSLCAPGTESFTIRKGIIDKPSSYKDLESIDPNLYKSLEQASKSNDDLRLFSRKIRTVHVTYSEPRV